MALQRDHFGRRVDAGNVQSVIGDAESGFYFLFQLLVRFAFGSEATQEVCSFWSFGIVVSFQELPCRSRREAFGRFKYNASWRP